MSDKYKHSEQFDLIFRYVDQSLQPEERYLVEREIEMDPFMREGIDGLMSLKGHEIIRDIKRIDLIAGKKQRLLPEMKYLIYIAGAMIVFALLFVVFNSIDFSKFKKPTVVNEDTDFQISEPYKPEILDTIDSLNVSVPDTQLQLALENKTLIEAKKAELEKKKNTLRKATEQLPTLKPATAIENNATSVSTPTLDIVEKQDEPKPEIKVEPKQEPVASPIKRPGVNAQPQPLGGNSLFKNYVDNNTRYPDNVDSRKRETLRVRFTVSKTGDPIGIIVENSPGESFTNEAIRVIKNGPKWSPKIEDGLPVESEVSVRMTFKP
jgi:TonB family protein